MSELKIDEHYIDRIIEKLEFVRDVLLVEQETLSNRDEDLFSRYLALHRCMFFVEFFMLLQNGMSGLFTAGHDLNHPFLQTAEAIKRGRGKTNINKNPFFVQEKD